MNELTVGGLQVQSDLQLVVDELHATIVSDGNVLTVSTDDAGLLLARAAQLIPSLTGRPASVRQSVARVGQLLDDASLRAHVIGHHGTLVELGRGCESSFGRIVLGSRHVTFGVAGALLPAATAYVRAQTKLRRRASYALGGVAIAVALATTRRRTVDSAGRP